ncbi:hypothetical protein EK904_003834 [Melospiza melodia maxima]|nr:hypothetical protein EK904_003834 [Melospiza melodia maxima]
MFRAAVCPDTFGAPRPGFHHNENMKNPGSVSLCRLKMTTATPLTNNTQLSVNVTTKSQEHNLYQSSGAIVAAIVVGVIVIFTVVLLILKTYNRYVTKPKQHEPKSLLAAHRAFQGLLLKISRRI